MHQPRPDADADARSRASLLARSTRNVPWQSLRRWKPGAGIGVSARLDVPLKLEAAELLRGARPAMHPAAWTAAHARHH